MGNKINNQWNHEYLCKHKYKDRSVFKNICELHKSKTASQINQSPAVTGVSNRIYGVHDHIRNWNVKTGQT